MLRGFFIKTRAALKGARLELIVLIIFQPFRAAGVAQFADGLGLYLAHTLARNVEHFARFFQGAGVARINPKAQAAGRGRLVWRRASL